MVKVPQQAPGSGAEIVSIQRRLRRLDELRKKKIFNKKDRASFDRESTALKQRLFILNNSDMFSGLPPSILRRNPNANVNSGFSRNPDPQRSKEILEGEQRALVTALRLHKYKKRNQGG